MNLVTALATARPPSGLSSFLVTPETAADNEASYRIACPCGAESGAIISEYDEDEQFWADPLGYECSVCDFSGILFDSRKDGYDAVLNGISTYVARTRNERVLCARCNSDRHKVVGEYTYQFEDEEVEQEWSEETRRQMPDVFDSVGFKLTCGQCGETQYIGGFECA
jgi:hypothetical protein